MSANQSQLSTDYDTLRTSVGAAVVARDAVVVEGRDAESYLQGQVTQNVEQIAVGESVWSFILQPHGKVDAFVRITRMADDAFVLDIDGGFADTVLERLKRFKLRTKVTFATPSWNCVALRGPGARAVATAAAKVEAVVRAPAQWRGIEGVDVFGPDAALPDTVSEVSADALEVVRIESGAPAMGHELDEKTIPAEVGLNALTIDFRKGCYTGQELVARIDARGNNVPRNLVGVVIEADEAPPRGASLVNVAPSSAQRPWGTLTSTAWSPRFGAGVALAFVRRDTPIPGEGLLIWDDTPSPAHVVPLPIEAT